MPADPISTVLLICETVLIEENSKIPSAIKIVDVFYVPEWPESFPVEQRALSVTILYIVAFPPEDEGEHELNLFLDRPGSEPIRLGGSRVDKLDSKLPGAPKVMNFSAHFGVLAKEMGTHYLRVVLDGKHEAKAQFTLARSPHPATRE